MRPQGRRATATKPAGRSRSRSLGRQAGTKRRKTSGQTLFVFKNFGKLHDPDDSESENTDRKLYHGPQLELIFKTAKYYSDSVQIPCELLIKIFKYVVESSDQPLIDLFNLSRVSEEWRCIILNSPALWFRVDISQIPMTDRNLNIIERLLKFNPSILNHVEEFSFGGSIQCKDLRKFTTFLNELLMAPKLKKVAIAGLKQQGRTSITQVISNSLQCCNPLTNLTITDSRTLFTNQRWLCDHLINLGHQLEVLNLAMSLSTVSAQLLKNVYSVNCPKLRVLDLSTCDALETQSFDAIQLSQNMPNLEVLRLSNVSLKKVHSVPERKGLTKLKELSMPKSMRDCKRDDNMVMTLTYGSDRITSLDLRGSDLTPCVLYDMPSSEVRELHLDDIYPPHRKLYYKFIKRWAYSLEVLSLVKINCSETIRKCLEALSGSCRDDDSPTYSMSYHTRKAHRPHSKLRELDLSTSDVDSQDLIRFLKATKSLESIDLTACRSLPRGCKCQFRRNSKDKKKLSLLIKALSASPTEPLSSNRTSRRLRRLQRSADQSSSEEEEEDDDEETEIEDDETETDEYY